MASHHHLLLSFITLLVLSLPVRSAPKSRSHSSSKVGTTYDQKQTGEYNIQLHLKDFQIIAVVGDDSIGSLGGDYDYSYDYSDFTVKPVVKPTTIKNPDSNNTTTETSVPTSKKPNLNNHHPYPIVSPATVKPSTTKKPFIYTQKPSTTTKPPTEPTDKLSTTTTTQKPEQSTQKLELIEPNPLTPGQIPVFVQDFPDTGNAVSFLKDGVIASDEKKGEVITNVAIVPSEDMGVDSSEQQNDHPSLGEILHYRRCAQGFSRDKRGRCRKVRRPPPIPLGITRFASSLAARFRQATGESSELTETESMDT